MLKNIINKNIVFLLFGNLVSRIGNVVYDVVIAWWVLEKTGNIKYSSYIFATSMFAVALLSPVSGVISDRFNKKRVLIITDIISGCAVISVSIMAYFDNINILILILSSFLLGTCSSLFKPTIKSIIPRISTKESFLKINSFSTNISELTKIIGPIFASILLTINFIGVSGALLFNGISFLISAVFEGFISYKETKKEIKQENIIKEIKQGFEYIIQKKIVLKIIILSSIANIFFSGFNILLPLYIKNILFGSAKIYSLALTSEALGGVAITLFLLLSKDIVPNLKNMFISLSLSGFFLLILSFVTSLHFFLISIFFMAVFLGWYNSVFFSYLQLNVDSNYIGRVFSIVYMSAVSIMPISYLVFGSVGEKFLNNSFLISGLGIVIATMFLSLYKNKKNVKTIIIEQD